MTAAALRDLANELRALRTKIAAEERTLRDKARLAAVRERVVATARGRSKRCGEVFVVSRASS